MLFTSVSFRSLIPNHDLQIFAAMQAQKRTLNGHAATPDTPASYYYGEDADMQPPAPEDVVDKLKRIGSVGEAAHRIADLVAREATERKQMIGGVDNFWLMLQDTTDFNPVRLMMSYYMT